jgi:hypothetical protein
VSYEFSLVLSREVTDDESAALLDAGPGSAVLTTAPLPTNADVTVTRLDFDTEAPTLAEAIRSALEAVKTVPDLSTTSLSVPAQPNGRPDPNGQPDGEKGPSDESAVIAAEVRSDSYEARAENGHAAPVEAKSRKKPAGGAT